MSGKQGKSKEKPQMVSAVKPTVIQAMIGFIDSTPFMGADAEKVLRLKAVLFQVMAKSE